MNAHRNRGYYPSTANAVPLPSQGEAREHVQTSRHNAVFANSKAVALPFLIPSPLSLRGRFPLRTCADFIFYESSRAEQQMATHLACGELKRMQAFFCRGISTEARKPRARCERTKPFHMQMLLRDIEMQRFYLDPAAALPCGLLVCFASPHKLRLRAAPCAQDDADGEIARNNAVSANNASIRNKSRITGHS